MLTVRHLERLWKAGSFLRLARELLASRPEASLRLETALARPLPMAALVLIRLDELDQGHLPFYRQLLKFLLAAQENDGGWGDPMTTAMCVRALACGSGEGGAIRRGVEYLAFMQKDEGVWPSEPIRRMPADAFVSAFILFQLGGEERFRQAIRFEEALAWFDARQSDLDVETGRLWPRAAARCGVTQDRPSYHASRLW